MRMRTAVVGGLVLTLAAAGCGEADEEPVVTVEDPLAAVQAASESTGELTSYRMASSVTVDESGGPCAAAFAGLAPAFELAVHDTGQGTRLEATDVATGATGRYVDGTVYIEGSGLPDWESPTPWVSIEGGEMGGQLDLALTPFSALDIAPDEEGEVTALSLEEMLDSLEIEGLSVTEVGPDEVRGQPATHYEVSTDAAVDADDQFASFDVWVGSDGYLRRMRASTPEVELGADSDTTDTTDEPFFALPALTMTLEIWDIGAEISIDAPPAGEVTPLADLEGPSGLDSLLPTDLLEACLPALGE